MKPPGSTVSGPLPYDVVSAAEGMAIVIERTGALPNEIATISLGAANMRLLIGSREILLKSLPPNHAASARATGRLLVIEANTKGPVAHLASVLT